MTKLNQSCFFCQFCLKSVTAQAGHCQWMHVLTAGEQSLHETRQGWHQHISHKWIRNLSEGNIRNDLVLQTHQWIFHSAFTQDTEYKILLPSESKVTNIFYLWFRYFDYHWYNFHLPLHTYKKKALARANTLRFQQRATRV